MENNEKSAKEIRRLQKVQRSQYMVQLVEVIPEVDKIYIVMELMAGGNLLSRVIQKGSLPEATVKRIAYRLVHGVLHMHQTLRLCHNDLQPSNILLLNNGNSNTKIADFGAATRRTRVPSFNSACHPPYRAPERRSSPAADMWSVGVILYFCLYGQHASLEQGCNALFDKLHNNVTASTTQQQQQDMPALSRHAKQFLCNLIHVDPDVRLTAQEALSHPWLSDMAPKDDRKTVVTFQTLPEHVSIEAAVVAASPECLPKRRPAKRVAESLGRFLSFVKGGELKQHEALESKASPHKQGQ